MKTIFLVITCLLLVACDSGQVDMTQKGQNTIYGGNWLLSSGQYVASDATYPVGKYTKTLSLSRRDLFKYTCLKKDSDTKDCLDWKEDLLWIQITVNYRIKENNFLSKDMSGIMTFTPEGRFQETSNNEISLSNSGELLFREFWESQWGDDSSEKSLQQEDRFRIADGKILGVERLFDERGEKVIYENESSFIRSTSAERN